MQSRVATTSARRARRARPRLLAAVAAAWLGSVADPVPAATRSWPGPAPCDATLAACIAASAIGDTVALATNQPIDESPSYAKVVSLVAATGYRPSFAPGRTVSVIAGDAPGWVLSLSGFTLERGSLSVFGNTAGTVHVQRVVVRDADQGNGISVSGSSPGTPFELAVRVRECSVRLRAQPATGISVVGVANAALDVLLADNTVEALGATPDGPFGRLGILAQVQDANALTVDVVRNRVLGDRGSANPLARLSSGILLRSGAAPAPAAMRAADNVVVLRNDSTSFNEAIRIVSVTDQPRFRVVNNSLLGADAGVSVFSGVAGAQVIGSIANNLIAYHANGAIQLSVASGTVGIDNANNLFFANGFIGVTPGPGTVQADPELVTLALPRLGASSPARDVGSVQVRTSGPGTLAALDPLDADGLRRVKLGVVDIGAFEYGDASLVHNTSGFAPVSVIDDPRLNARPDELPQVTRSGGAFPAFLGSPNPRPMSQRYVDASARWELLADDGFNLNTNAGFHVFVPGSGTGRGLQVATAGNVSGPLTQLAAAITALGPDAIVLLTPIRGGGVPNPHPVAATWQFGAWFAWNIDGAAMPLNARFTVYAQPPSASAYLHVTEAGNQPSPLVTVLDHPRLNGNPCAAPHVGLGANGALNPHPIGVRYDPGPGAWYAFNEDSAALPVGTQLHVVIDPGAGETSCADGLFASGFEDAF